MPEIKPNMDAFAEYYIDAQKAAGWPVTQLLWTRTKLPHPHGEASEAAISVPSIKMSPDYFDGKEMKEFATRIEEMMSAGENFVIIKPENLPQGSGWKTFLMGLLAAAKELDYDILQSRGSSFDVSWISLSSRLEHGTYNINTTRKCPQGIDDNPSANQELGGWIESMNTDFKERRAIFIATEGEYEGEFRNSGIRSKMSRISPNGKGGLPKLVYPQTDWQEVIKKRIDQTPVHLADLELADKVLKNKNFIKCQPGQERVTERFLKLTMNALNARLIGVLQGNFGIGKSRLLARGVALLDEMKGQNVLSYEHLRQAKYERHTTGGKSNFTVPDLMVIDDKFGNSEGAGDLVDTFQLMRKRPSVLAASNVKAEVIKSTMGASINDCGWRDPGYNHTRRPPFVYMEVLELPGRDYNE